MPPSVIGACVAVMGDFSFTSPTSLPFKNSDAFRASATNVARCHRPATSVSLQSDRAPAVLTKMRLQLAIGFDRETPLPFIARVTILTYQHLLSAREVIRIEPQRNREPAAGKLVRCP